MSVKMTNLKSLAKSISDLIVKEGEVVKIDSNHFGNALLLVNQDGGVDYLIANRWTKPELYYLMQAYRKGILKGMGEK
jgi:hypothetical protein